MILQKFFVGDVNVRHTSRDDVNLREHLSAFGVDVPRKSDEFKCLAARGSAESCLAMPA